MLTMTKKLLTVSGSLKVRKSFHMYNYKTCSAIDHTGELIVSVLWGGEVTGSSMLISVSGDFTPTYTMAHIPVMLREPSW
jgi:hypothetical protein